MPNLKLSSDHYEKILSNIPETMQRPFKSSYLGKKCFPDIIKAKCLDCSGYERQEVKNCTVTSCPIWRFRPYKD